MGSTPDESARETAAFETKGGANVGSAILHITTAGLVLVSVRHGVIFDIAWDRLYTATRRGKSGIKLSWDDGAGHLVSYDLAFGDPGPVMHELRAANEAYAAQVSLVESLRAAQEGTEQEPPGGTRTDFGNNECHWHTTEVTEKSVVLASSKVPVVAPRDTRIPWEVPDRHVWNDAWYDSEAGSFVTHNALFCRADDVLGPGSHGMYDSRRADGSVTLARDDVSFLHGYPAVNRKWDGDGGMRSAWTLLSTIRAEMLTSAMAFDKVSEPAGRHLTYLTDPAGVYVPRFHAPVSVHETVLFNSEMRKYAQSAYRGVIDQLNYLRENVSVAGGSQGTAGGAMRHHDAQDAHDDPNFRKWMLEPDRR